MKCPHCGATCSDSAKFCTTCGAALSELAETPVQTVHAVTVDQTRPRDTKDAARAIANAHLAALEVHDEQVRVKELEAMRDQSNAELSSMRWWGRIGGGLVATFFLTTTAGTGSFGSGFTGALSLVLATLMMWFMMAWMIRGFVAIWRTIRNKGFFFIGSLAIMAALFMILMFVAPIIGPVSYYRTWSRAKNSEQAYATANENLESMRAALA